MAVIAAMLGLATVTAVATADPTDTTSPAPPPTTSSSPPESTPPESSGPPSSASPTESPSQTDTPPAATSVEEVEVAAAFGKPSYATAEEMTITLTVRNTGNEPVTLHAYFPHGIGDNGIRVTATSTFEENEHFTLAAGASTTNVLTGVAVDPNFTTATLHVSVSDGEARKLFSFPVPVTPRSAPVSGVLFEDRNGNGTVDSGEGVGFTEVVWRSAVNDFYREEVRTNAGGEFALDVSPGTYDVWAESSYLFFPSRSVVVPASGLDDVLVKGTRRLHDLAADVEFTKDTYKPDETPTVRVKLTNKGDVPLSGVVANCYGSEDGHGLTGTGAGWGDLAGAGVTVAPGATVVREVTEPMPPRAHDHGYVSVDCEFRYPGYPDARNPRDADYSTVPGRTATLTGRLYRTTDGTGFADVRVLLTSVDGCPIVAETRTDAEGRFTLGPVPAGRYHFYTVPPPGWGFKFPETTKAPVSVPAGPPKELNVALWQSNTPPLPPPNCPGGGPGANPPGPQGSAKPGLAYTGASMLVPGIAGLAALLAGIATVALTRRRRTT